MERYLFNPPKIDNHFSINSKIVLNHGDILEFIKTVPDDQISLIITSPPYNIGKKYEKKIPIEKYLEQQEAVIKELIRVLKDGGSLCWQVGNFVENGEVFPLDIYYYKIFKEMNLKLRNRIVWYFGHGLHAKKRFSGRYETLLWFTKTDKYTFNLDSVRVPAKYPGKRSYKGKNKGKPSGNPLGKNPSDFWEMLSKEWDEAIWKFPNVKSNHPEKTIHPCQFPIELVERCVLAFTNKNEWILDPYCGVGSSLIAGLLHERKVAGCDKEKIYIDIAKQRIFDFFSGKFKRRAIGTPIYEPKGHEKVVQVPFEWKKSKRFKKS